MDKHFNLIDEPWLPVAGKDRVSLRQVFSDPELPALGGNPVEKIALMKLLLAIAQAAATPEDDAAWRAMGADGMARKCLAYLDQWHDRFDLYGERPFLQMPAIAKAKIKSYGTVLPEIATGNTTILTHGQVERSLSDAEKAVLLVCLMGFALGGKQADNTIVLSRGYVGKCKNGKPAKNSQPGPSVASRGLLHTCFQGENVCQTVWLNLLTEERITQNARFPAGLGTAPWEQMPVGEDDEVARKLKSSVMGRLVPLCRFSLLAEAGLHYSDGVAHTNYKDGMCDPTVAVNWSGKEPKALWTDPEKRPWRELTALLGFLAQQQIGGFECWQLTACLSRACESVDAFAIWSAGLRVSNDMGEQRTKGNDDFVESCVALQSSALGSFWFSNLQTEMDALGDLHDGLSRSVKKFFRRETPGDKDDRLGEATSKVATQLFWQLCERDFQTLIYACGSDGDSATINSDARHRLRRRFADYAQQAYDRYCPKDTARQLDAWARCRPNHSKYLQPEA
ncbi:MAG: type I-E CRISPR-associated protein Cse1/CasA [Xanthomonadales bacterium]|nr:type I-E CRISPR-associated protein Cse1/CasA [Xanthomonadales bacterium]